MGRTLLGQPSHTHSLAGGRFACDTHPSAQDLRTAVSTPALSKGKLRHRAGEQPALRCNSTQLVNSSPVSNQVWSPSPRLQPLSSCPQWQSSLGSRGSGPTWTPGGRVHRAELCRGRNEVEEAGGMEAGEGAQVERLVGLGWGGYVRRARG